jgi:3',5'-cyclic-AMP phosphodiesterase
MTMGGRLAAVMAVLAASCFEYSPHAVVLDDSERGLHQKALARLDAETPPALLRFAVVGDAHLWFEEAKAAVASLNARDDLAFVVQIGDIMHVGLMPELRLMNEEFAHLRVPYFVVMGNHEHLGNGEDGYRAMFGDPALAFTFARTRFVLFDSNSREFDFDGTVPDVARLAAEVQPDGTFDHVVLLSHVPPGTSDFDASRVEAYDALLRAQPSVISFHGHEHAYRSEVREGTLLFVADALDGRSYLVAAVHPDGLFEVERVSF